MNQQLSGDGDIAITRAHNRNFQAQAQRPTGRAPDRDPTGHRRPIGPVELADCI
jgi:hypothetical protein